MARQSGLVGLALLAAVPGCFPTSETAMVPASPFGAQTTSTALMKPDANAPPATAEASRNVARVGLKVVCANPGLGSQPLFITIGGPNQPFELFHSGDSNIFITETLARQCKTEGELAALLSTELGRMAAERAAIHVADARDLGPPPAVNVGNDYGGAFGPADGTRMMELAKYERKRALAREQTAPPAPEALARTYLEHAGYNPADVDNVAGLLRAADAHSSLEKLMTPPAAK
jgi:hypothetical protein